MRRIAFGIVALLVTSGIIPHTYGSGGVDGNGGDSRCFEFNAYLVRLNEAFRELGEETLRKKGVPVDLDQLSVIVEKARCVPVENLDRGARSDSTTLTTHLDRAKWSALTVSQKSAIATHELFVLARIEGDGEYQHSQKAFALLSDTAAFRAIGLLDGAKISNTEEVRLSPEDGQRFLIHAEEVLSGAHEILEQLRLLSIEAVAENLADVDRGYLNDEYQQHKENLMEILDGAEFRDEFNETYRWVRAGASFKFVKTLKSGIKVTRRVRIPALPLTALGQIAEVVVPVTVGEYPVNAELVLNGISTVRPKAGSETSDNLFSIFADSSAISLASAINATAHKSDIVARTGETVLDLGTFVTDKEIPLQLGVIVINGVSLTGRLRSVGDFINGVNEKADASGVRASLIPSHELPPPVSKPYSGVRLFSRDGRNIHFQIKDKKLEKHFPDLATFGASADFVKGGLVRIYSQESFEIMSKDFYPIGFVGKKKFFYNVEAMLLLSNINTQEGAQKALDFIDKALMQISDRLALL